MLSTSQNPFAHTKKESANASQPKTTQSDGWPISEKGDEMERSKVYERYHEDFTLSSKHFPSISSQWESSFFLTFFPLAKTSSLSKKPLICESQQKRRAKRVGGWKRNHIREGARSTNEVKFHLWEVFSDDARRFFLQIFRIARPETFIRMKSRFMPSFILCLMVLWLSTWVCVEFHRYPISFSYHAGKEMNFLHFPMMIHVTQRQSIDSSTDNFAALSSWICVK